MKLVAIIGPTAVGKTKLAVQLAHQMGAEVISADSRQVFRDMNIGTGKDLDDFIVDGKEIPFHLINIREAGEEYDVFQFQRDFFQVFERLSKEQTQAILCGGTGMYVQAALSRQKMVRVPENPELREELDAFNQEELANKLLALKPSQHNTTDLLDRRRTIRAIEIESFLQHSSKEEELSPVTEYLLIGLRMERETLRERIKERLLARLEEGMIEEVKQLIEKGVSYDQLNFYGLEYRYISDYLQAKTDYDTMFNGLLKAIRQFAKKQMTWYRRMEKQGIPIHWVDASLPMNEKLQQVLNLVRDEKL